MPLVTAAQIEKLMVTGLDAPTLTALIAREEAWLADDPLVGIGQLVGERTLKIRVRDPWLDLKLQRPPDPETLEVRDNGAVLTADVGYALVSAAAIRRLTGPWVGPIVEVDLTPVDGPAVTSAVIELVRLAVSASPFRQESTEGHSYTKPAELQQMREDIARSVHPHRGPSSVHLTGGAPR